MVDENCVSQLTLERLLNRECSPMEEQALLVKIENNSDLKERYEALKESNTEILTRYPSSHVAKDILQRFKQRTVSTERRRQIRPFPRWAMALPVMIVSVLLVSLLPMESIWHPTNPGEDGIRFKGISPKLLIFRKLDGNIEQLQSGMSVRQSDVVQLRYVTAGAKYGVIFSVDGRGSVTLHFPTKRNDSTALNTSAEESLDYAYELDDAPDFERFFFVTSKLPLDVNAILTKVDDYKEDKQAGTLDLSANINFMSVLLKKVE